MSNKKENQAYIYNKDAHTHARARAREEGEEKQEEREITLKEVKENLPDASLTRLTRACHTRASCLTLEFQKILIEALNAFGSMTLPSLVDDHNPPKDLIITKALLVNAAKEISIKLQQFADTLTREEYWNEFLHEELTTRERDAFIDLLKAIDDEEEEEGEE